jgi:hypothetical protein
MLLNGENKERMTRLAPFYRLSLKPMVSLVSIDCPLPIVYLQNAKANINKCNLCRGKNITTIFQR